MDTPMEFHEAANLLPLDDDNIPALADDIREHGQKIPIELMDGKVLDGRRRWLACKMAGLTPITRSVTIDDPIAHVLSLNKHRRHMTPSQLAILGAKVKEMYSAQAKERMQLRKGKQAGASVEQVPHLETGKARDLAGKAVGVSGKLIDRGEKVLEKGTPELVAAVEQGRMSVSMAAEIADRDEETQKQIAAASHTSGGRYRTPKVPAAARVISAPVEIPGDEENRWQKEAREFTSGFYANLEKLSDGGVYTSEAIAAAIGGSKVDATWFVRMCEVCPLVQVHRTFGRKLIVQYTFVKTGCNSTDSRIRQLASQIAADATSSHKSKTAAEKILSLLGN